MRDDIDKILNQVISNQMELVNHDSLWAGIEMKLKRKRRKRFIFWLFGFSIFSLILIIFIFLNFRDNNELVANILSTNFNSSIYKDDLKCIEDSLEIIKSNPIINVLNNEIKVNENKFLITNIEKKYESNSMVNIECKNVPSPNGFDVSYTENTLSNAIIENDLINKSNISDIKLTDQNDLILSNYNSDNGGSANLQSNLKLEPIKLSDIFIESYATSNFIIKIKKLNYLNSFSNSTLRYFNNVTIKSIYFSGSKRINFIPNSDFELFKNSSDTFLDVISFSVETELLKWRRIGVDVGLGFNSLTDKFEWNGIVFKDEIRNYHSSTIYSLTQSPVENYTTGETKIKYEKFIKFYNQYSIIVVPVKLNYSFVTNRIEYKFYGGINFNYRLKSDLSYFSSNFDVESLILKPSMIKPNFIVGGQISYNLNNDFIFGINIENRRLHFSNHVFNQKYNLWGIGISLSKNICN